MSRLWPDRLLASLSPEGIALLRVARGLHPRVLWSTARACDPQHGPAPWHGALGALQAALEQLRSKRLDATVILSNHFARYALVPWSAELDGPEAELAYARHVMLKTFGDGAKAWEIRLTEEVPGSARLAAAIDAALLAGLRACFAKATTLRLISIQPLLMSAFNRWRQQVEGTAGWLLLSEPGRACLARFENSRWVAVRNARLESAASENLLALLQQESNSSASGAPGPVHFYSTTLKSFAGADGWRVAPLVPAPAAGAGNDARYALALTAV